MNTSTASPATAPFDWTRVPLRPALAAAIDPAAAELIRALRDAERRQASPDPWLWFPQQSANAGFGPEARPLPVGALRVLWRAGCPFVQACPGCEGRAYVAWAGAAS